MASAEFDRHAKHYRDVHAENIIVSGESPEYFADYKIRDFADLVASMGRAGNGQFLDFGCGVGNSVSPFRKYFPEGRLITADVSGESLRMVKGTYGNLVDALLIENGTLQLDDKSIDGAFANCVFHHIDFQHHQSVLKELRRVLRPGAPLMVYEHNPLNPMTLRAVNTCPLDEHAVLIRARVMRQRLSDSGFTAPRIAYRVFFPALLRRLRPLEQHLKWLPLGAQYYVVARA